jgi:signal transduction histidine kinase
MRGGDRLGAAAVGAGLTSLAVDAAVLLRGTPYPQGQTVASALGAAEVLVLLILIVLALRRARGGVAVAAGASAGLAVPLWLLRFGPPERSPESLGGFAAWGTLALLAVAVGLYLRALDERRTRAVTVARREQRLRLADDLHDFVVHDINEMLLQAQAGRVLLGSAPSTVAGVDDVLRRIEGAALRALETVDRTVHVLHHEADTDGAPRSPQPMLNDLPALVERFAATGPATAHLELDPALPPDGGADSALPPELSTTVYRVVLEALTNVRRHAADARHVRVMVSRTTDGGARVEVADDGRAHRSARSAGRVRGGSVLRAGSALGGLGLTGLRERVGALGGTLDAGPAEPAGWRVTAVLPARLPRRAVEPMVR